MVNDPTLRLPCKHHSPRTRCPQKPPAALTYPQRPVCRLSRLRWGGDLATDGRKLSDVSRSVQTVQIASNCTYLLFWVALGKSGEPITATANDTFIHHCYLSYCSSISASSDPAIEVPQPLPSQLGGLCDEVALHQCLDNVNVTSIDVFDGLSVSTLDVSWLEVS